MRRYAEGRIFFLLRCASLPENHAKRMCCVTLNMSQASFSHGCFWRPGNQQQPCTGAQQSSCDWLQQHVGCCSSTQEQNIQLAKPCTSVHSLEAPNLPQNRTQWHTPDSANNGRRLWRNSAPPSPCSRSPSPGFLGRGAKIRWKWPGGKPFAT